MTRDKYILLLDSSTDYCSVALARRDEQSSIIELIEKEESDRTRQSERLALMANQLLKEIPKESTLSAICVAEGPGSYTGLRIAAGYAKGLAFARSLPLLAIPTTLLIVRSLLARQSVPSDALLLPMIDARRMEVYTALYSSTGEAVSEIVALVLTDAEVQQSLKELVGDRPLLYFGSGAEKAIPLFSELLPNSECVKGIYPKAKDMAEDAFRLLEATTSLDVAYWEPFYLKEYEAKKSLNKVLLQALQNE